MITIVARWTCVLLTGRNFEYKFPLIIFFLALLVRLVYLWEISSSPGFAFPLIDAQRYFNEAQMVASGDLIGGKLSYWQPPLYQFILGVGIALFGLNHFALHLAHFVLGAINCVLLYLVGRKFFSEGVSKAASLIACFYGPFLYFEGEYLPPVILVFLALLILLLVLRAADRPKPWTWFLVGFTFGLHMIARPDILLFFPMALAWLVSRNLYKINRSFLITLTTLFTAGLIIPVIPVTVRNYVAEGVFVPISYNGGINFYIGNNPDYDKTVAVRPGVDWLDLVMEPLFEEQVPTNERPAVFLGKSLEQVPTNERSAYFFGKSFEWIEDNPEDWARLIIRKGKMFWKGHEFIRNLNPYTMRDYSWLLSVLMWEHVIAFPFGLISPLALLGIIFAMSRPGPERGLLLLFTLASFLSVILFFITSRYRIPLVPVLLLFACYAVTAIYRRMKVRMWASSLTIVFVFSGLLILCNHSASKPLRQTPSDEVYWLGSIASKKGEYEEADTYYRQALEGDPSNAQYRINVALTSLALDQPDKAVEQLQWVLDHEGQVPVHAMLQSHKFLGKIYKDGGDYDKAVKEYRACVAISPHKIELRLLLAQALIMGWEYDEAEWELQQVIELDPENEIALSMLDRLKNRGGLER
jgi:tetratricopeptide (TPR) repeat protein